MTRNPILLCAAVLAAAIVPSSAAFAATSQDNGGAQLAQACAAREGWSDPATPAAIFANTWYVGTCGISAVLITGDQGNILIDGGVKEAAPLILANITRLGFKPEDVRWILSSHEHSDHAGALAALKRATGAKIAALASEKPFLENGRSSPDDPQLAQLEPFDPVKVDRTLADGESIVLGKLAVTAHETPAHSPGSTSWTWQSCDEKFTCRMIAYADSATVISAKGYRFSDHPDRIAAANLGLERIAALPCDILVTPHSPASNLFERLAGKASLIDSSACRTYAAAAQARFAARLDQEKKEARR